MKRSTKYLFLAIGFWVASIIAALVMRIAFGPMGLTFEQSMRQAAGSLPLFMALSYWGTSSEARRNEKLAA